MSDLLNPVAMAAWSRKYLRDLAGPRIWDSGSVRAGAEKLVRVVDGMSDEEVVHVAREMASEEMGGETCY